MPIARPVGIPPIAGTEDPGALSQWPVQLHLLTPGAPFLRGADLLLAADCVAFARGDFHSRLLRGKALAIACPKLDDPSGYIEKLAAMMAEGGIRSLTVAIMEVPCCRGLERIAEIAMKQAPREIAREIPVRRVVIGVDGRILQDQPGEWGASTGSAR
jgi:hypothetical protein